VRPGRTRPAVAPRYGFALAALSAGVGAATLDVRVENAFGPLTEFGETRAVIALYAGASEPDSHLRCEQAGVTRAGNVFDVVARLDPGAPSPGFVACEHRSVASLGTLSPGVYSVVANVVGADGRSVSVMRAEFSVTERGTKCNADPRFNTLTFTLAAKSLDEFARALAEDPAYRAQMGDIVYLGAAPYPRLAHPELQDPVRVMDRLMKTREFTNIAPGDGALCFATSPPDDVRRAIEYHNVLLDHYFVTAYAHEQAAIESSVVGPGWVRTGESFAVVMQPGCPVASEGAFHPGYRFTGIPGRGPSSHFFGILQSECAVVRDRADWGWQYEGIPFWAEEPAGGECRHGTPLRRAYNNGSGGAPNHRYSVNPATIASMVARGWIDEGVAMCVAGP